jgi:hypothetical protein
MALGNWPQESRNLGITESVVQNVEQSGKAGHLSECDFEAAGVPACRHPRFEKPYAVRSGSYELRLQAALADRFFHCAAKDLTPQALGIAEADIAGGRCQRRQSHEPDYSLEIGAQIVRSVDDAP